MQNSIRTRNLDVYKPHTDISIGFPATVPIQGNL